MCGKSKQRVGGHTRARHGDHPIINQILSGATECCATLNVMSPTLMVGAILM